MRLASLLLLLHFFLLSASAETIYIANAAAGSDTGADPANAHGATWVNSAANWGAGAGKVSAGDTLYLVDGATITTNFITQASGTSGNPITFQFGTGTKMSTTAWSDGFAAININHSYITVDGGTNGIIECTDNGAGGGFTFHRSCSGVIAAGVSHTTVKNLTIRNLFVRTAGTDINGSAAYGIAFRGTANNLSANYAWNNTINDCFAGIIGEYGAGCSDYDFGTNTIYNVNWGFGVPDRTTGCTITNIRVHNNNVHDFTNWNETSANSFHHNGIFLYAVQANSAVLDFQVYDNTFGPGLGNAYQTGLVFCQSTVVGGDIFNNLFLANAGEYCGNAMIVYGPTSTNGTVQIIGNTFKNVDGVTPMMTIGQYASGQTTIVKNNIGLSTNATGTFIQITQSGNHSSIQIDYNLGYGISTTQGYSYTSTLTPSYKTFAQWQSLGFDTHGVTSNPDLDGTTYIPQAGSPAISAGTLLSSPFDFDAAGVTRPNPPTIGWKEPTSSCSYSLDSTNATANTAGTIISGSSTVAVTTTSGCTWTSSANVSWLTITSGFGGTGSGTITYSVAANTGPLRVGTLTIAGNTFTVTQAGVVFAPLSISGNVRISGYNVLK